MTHQCGADTLALALVDHRESYLGFPGLQDDVATTAQGFKIVPSEYLKSAAVGRSSAQSLYRRFFGVRRHFTDQEIAFFTKVDFINHVALVAVSEENDRTVIVGA